MSLIGSQTIPADGFCIVLRDTTPLFIANGLKHSAL